MLFSWWRARTRHRVGLSPFPPAWDEFLRRGVKQVQWLSAEELSRLRRWMLVFLAEKRFAGCRGLDIDDEMRVTIAAQAGLVALGFDELWFDRLARNHSPAVANSSGTNPAWARPRRTA